MSSKLPPLTARHVAQSTTFTPPPLDGSLTLPEIYDWHLEHTPNHRLFVFCDDKGTKHTIYWPEAVKAVHSGARRLRSAFDWKPSTVKVSVVAILAMSDTVTYFTTIMSVLRAGYIAFLISPRNSASAVAHLLHTVAVQYVLVGNDQSMQDLAKESLKALNDNYPPNTIQQPTLFPMPHFEDLFISDDNDLKPLIYEPRKLNEIAVYLHSSGSTAFPKPVALTQRRLIEFARIPYYGDRCLTNQVMSLHTMPMYHGMGFTQCCWTAACGLVLSSFAPKFPAQVPNPESHFQSAVATQSDIVFSVPSVIEAWSRNPDYVKWLSTRTGIIFGGGPLNKAAGDYMVSQGVTIFILYGSTEGGIMSLILPAHVGIDWEYFKFAPDFVKYEMIPQGDGTSECVMLVHDNCIMSVINSKMNGIDAYATSDLFKPHPTKSGYWKVFGRTDDQIMHNTGEKTNPGPLETILNQDPHVQSSVMFGRGKFQVGVIIDPKPAFKFDSSDERALEQFRNKIWPTIQKMNAYAPQHSRLFKEMVLVEKPSKPYTYTAKNTPRRQAIINLYNEEIEAVYDAVEATTQSNIQLPEIWDVNSVTDFVRKIVGNVLVHKVKDDDDIFQHGCDSLQATWIRNALSRALRDGVKADTRSNTDNFVYEYPTISKLSSFLISNASGNVTAPSSILDKQQEMEEMVAKYSADFPQHIPLRESNESACKTVLLTGSTGGIGAFLLHGLVLDDNVEHVYCINRPSKSHSSSLYDRHRDSFTDKDLPVEELESKKVSLLEASLDEEKWGLGTTYDTIHNSVTHIIHNAWPVDFNLSLASFETNIKGLRSLIDFALSSNLRVPPTIVYTSSIGVFQNITTPATALLEQPISATVAINNGYTESKWVSEQVLAAASASTDLKTVTVRVGQVVGGPNGYWDTKQWFPAIVQSVKVLKCLPDSLKGVSWIPVHIAARALIEFLDSHKSALVHLAHPKTTSCSVLTAALSSQLRVPLVSYAEWFSRLEKEKLSASNIAALRLLGFFKNTGDQIQADSSFVEAYGLPHLDTTRARALSSSLANAEPLTEYDARKWLEYWITVGFVQPD